jgi:hypothetical protein
LWIWHYSVKLRFEVIVHVSGEIPNCFSKFSNVISTLEVGTKREGNVATELGGTGADCKVFNVLVISLKEEIKSLNN